MGSLAMWGAIGGAGKGQVENAEATRKVEAAQMEADRQMRLAQFAQTNENERQGKQLASEESRTREEVAGRTANVATEQTGLNARSAAEVAERKAANEGRSKAMIQIGAGHDAARVAAASNAAKAKNGWSQKVLKTTGFDPQSHLPVQTDQVAVTHPAYGTFVQNGDKFVPQGTSATSLKRAPIADVNDLLTNTDHADAFLTTHGYLPASYFKVIGGKGQMNMATDEPASGSQPSADDPALEGLSPEEREWATQPAQ